MKLILQSIYFMLPAYLANMAPVLLQWIPFGARPIHEKLFGAHKTYRGIIGGVIFAIITLFLQRKIDFFYDMPLLSYKYYSHNHYEFWLLGFLFGFGALTGDLVKSFFKRRLGIASGKPWVPFDQLDFVIGALLFVSIIYIPPISHIVIILVLSPILSLLTNIAAYSLNMKKVWW